MLSILCDIAGNGYVGRHLPWHICIRTMAVERLAFEEEVGIEDATFIRRMDRVSRQLHRLVRVLFPTPFVESGGQDRLQPVEGERNNFLNIVDNPHSEHTFVIRGMPQTDPMSFSGDTNLVMLDNRPTICKID